MTKIIIFFLLSTVVFAHDHIPHDDPHDTDYELNLRYIKKLNPFSYITDLKIRQQFQERKHLNLRTGYLKRFNKNFKYGAFLELQTGNRHDNDWIAKGYDWVWYNSDNRVELLTTGDITYRKRVARKLVFEIKNRLSYNTFNENTFARIRPGLNYFIIDKYKTPLWNILLQYEYYHPFNYGNTTPYEQWIYLSTLYHQTAYFKWGPMISHKKIHWEASESFKNKFPAEDYEVVNTATIYGLNFLFVY